MSESRLGIPARVMFAHAPSGRDLEPERVEHLQFGITWDVTGILDRRQHPGRAEQTLGKATLTQWWLLKVSGPLPWCPPITANSSCRSAATATGVCGGSR